MSVTWRKVWRDMWRNKLRTLLVVLATAVGVFALGFVYGTSSLLETQLNKSHRESVPAHVILYTSIFGDELVETVQGEPNVDRAEGQRVVGVRWRLEGEDEWLDGAAIAKGDFHEQQVHLFTLGQGTWPEDAGLDRAIAVETLASRHYGIPIGSTVEFELGRSVRRIEVQGIARHPDAAPPPLGNAIFYTSPATLAWLQGYDQGEVLRRPYNRLYVRVTGLPEVDTTQDPEAKAEMEEALNEAGEELQRQLERMGLSVGGFAAIDPNEHPIQTTVESLMVVLTVLGALSLGLSGFLIVNVMNATIAQQVWQIGVMKVLGATSGRVMWIYLVTALAYGLLALALAVVPGALASYLLSAVLLNLFNVPVGPMRLIPSALAIQLAVGLLVPPVAALIPVLAGARITPHQAISSYGLGGRFGKSPFDRLIGRIRFLPRPLALSLRNTFRRKMRIALTLITLVLGGVMFVGVLSVGTSLNRTLEVLLDDLGFDALVVFRRTYREVRLVQAVESVPDITRAEVWHQAMSQIALDNGEQRETILWAVPDDSEMFRPRIVAGRGFEPGDGRAILLNSKIAADEGIGVGDEITLEIEDQESSWTVVGLILNVNNMQRDSFVLFDALARETGNVNRGALVMVTVAEDTAEAQQQAVRDLRAACKARHMDIAIAQTAYEARTANKAVFNVIIYLMMAMAVLAAIVGSVGLMSTMSINVVERRREIGVMRAIGAQSTAILGILVLEGLLVGLLSWAIAVPLSYPGALAFNRLVSTTLLKVPMDFDYSFLGGFIWLIIVGMLSTVASIWPALRATRISVRESLAYE